MKDFTTRLNCLVCHSNFYVPLRKVRFNIEHPCPFCAFPNHVSTRQAVAAQRLLERLELKRVVRVVTQPGSLSGSIFFQDNSK